MSEFTKIEKPFSFDVSPISINADKSISIAISVGFVVKNEATGEESLDIQSQQTHYLMPNAGEEALKVQANKGETAIQALKRGILDVLRAKGATKL